MDSVAGSIGKRGGFNVSGEILLNSVCLWFVELLRRLNDWREILVVITSDCHYHQGNPVRCTWRGGCCFAIGVAVAVVDVAAAKQPVDQLLELQARRLE